MFFCANKIIRSVVKFDNKFISLIKKTRKPILTQDEQLIPDIQTDVSNISRPISRRGTNVFDLYKDKAIEGLDLNDERFGSIILKARNLNTEENNFMVIEGKNMICDAVKLNANVTHIFFTNRELLKDIPYRSSNKTQIFYVKYRNMQKFSNLTTNPGLMAVVERPDPSNYLTDCFISKKLPLTLILDNIRDPGNLGTIIRTAAGFNINKILMTRGCVDLYNEKVIRSSMSSIFCTPVFNKLSWDEIRNSLNPNCVLYYADTRNNNTDTQSYAYYESYVGDFKDNKLYGLVIGGEIDGVCEEAKQLVSDTHGYKLHIPIINNVNSLNSAIAATIIMSEFQRKYLYNK